MKCNVGKPDKNIRIVWVLSLLLQVFISNHGGV